jgi:predicted alpha/beta hydrolase family esterase
MKQALILHGMPDKDESTAGNHIISNSHWLPWLREQLLQHGISAVTPEMPNPYDPEWKTWCAALNNYEITPKTILVGHSGGAGFWVRYLSENPSVRVGKVVLVAPWLDPDNDETNGFFDFEIDPNSIERTGGITIFNSDNDMGNIHKSVALLRQAIPTIHYREFHKYGHFTKSHMGTVEFPELLHELI